MLSNSFNGIKIIILNHGVVVQVFHMYLYTTVICCAVTSFFFNYCFTYELGKQVIVLFVHK